jgi:membrane protease YdiL (CAAX protease family)
MPAELSVTRHRESVLQRHPVASYFALTFALSWTGALLVAAPHLLRRETIPKMSGLLMFPVMLVGPSLVGILMTLFTRGRKGLSNLLARMRRLRVPAGWYAVLLIPPTLVLAVLFALKTFWSPIFAPNNFWVGVSFGCIAGFFEEIGWTGYAFPELSAERNGFAAAIFLGVFWGIWHLPVVDYLGSATPHGAYWFRFFLAFTAAMTAMRVLISWLSARTNSIALAQLMHAVSTGSLVVFSPPRVSAAQETTWYAVYAVALWLTVAVLATTTSGSFSSPQLRHVPENTRNPFG